MTLPDWTTDTPTKPGIYWVTDAPVLRALGLKKVDLVKVFYIQEYREYDTEPTLCVGIRGWNESIESFTLRHGHKSKKPRWIGPMEAPDA
jgi:hypothetical protein